MLEAAGGKNGNNNDFQFWQQHNHRIKYTAALINQKLEYMHENPLVAGFVDESSAQLWSGCAS